MNTSLIATLNKHYIYYINGSQLSFYIAIPYKEFNTTNITLELYPDYELLNPNNNDSIWIKDEITRIYKEIDNDNITLVIPIFYDDRLKQTNNIMDQNLYLGLDSNISSTINSAYQILSKSNINVASRIILINNGSFDNFSRWFLERYKTRIEHKKYFELKSNNINVSTPTVPETPPQTQTPFSNPVSEPNIQVGSPNGVPVQQEAYVQPSTQNTNINNQINPNNGETQKIEPLTNVFTNNTPNNENVEVPDAGSAGFVSYLLLGVITVIVCLSILYIML